MKRAFLLSAGLIWASCGAPQVDDFDSEGDDLETLESGLTNKAQAWFPLAAGNRWELASDVSQKVLAVDATSDEMAYVSGFLPVSGGDDGKWLAAVASTPNNLYEWNSDEGEWSILFRFGYAVTPWTWGKGACSTFTLKRKASNATVTTPAGTFTQVRTISLTQKPAPYARCAAPVFSEISFAPNVGIVRAVTGMGEVVTLQRATVAGVSYPKPPVVATLKADKAQYVNKHNTIYCITTPCPGNAVTAEAKLTYTVKNTGTQTERWDFRTGCKFDVELFDAAGQSMRALMPVQFCTQALSVLTLAPGQSHVFTTSLPLEGFDGVQLHGAYTAQAHLLAQSSATSSNAIAQTAINVTVQ